MAEEQSRVRHKPISVPHGMSTHSSLSSLSCDEWVSDWSARRVDDSLGRVLK